MAVALVDLGERRPHAVRVANVGDDRQCLPTDLGGRLLESFLTTGKEHELGAGGTEARRRRFPDPGRRAGDDHDLAFEAFELARPVISLRVQGRRSAFVFGTLPARRLDAPSGPDRMGPHALLPPLQREAFLLHEEAGLSVTEIAAATGTQEEAAKSRLRYAMAKLKAAIDDG